MRAASRPSAVLFESRYRDFVPYQRNVGLLLHQPLQCSLLCRATRAALQGDELTCRRHPHTRIAKASIVADDAYNAFVDFRIALVRATALASAGEAARRAPLRARMSLGTHFLLAQKRRLSGRASRITCCRLTKRVELIVARLLRLAGPCQRCS